jgi:hypothetical protein
VPLCMESSCLLSLRTPRRLSHRRRRLLRLDSRGVSTDRDCGGDRSAGRCHRDRCDTFRNWSHSVRTPGGADLHRPRYEHHPVGHPSWIHPRNTARKCGRSEAGAGSHLWGDAACGREARGSSDFGRRPGGVSRSLGQGPDSDPEPVGGHRGRSESALGRGHSSSPCQPGRKRRETSGPDWMQRPSIDVSGILWLARSRATRCSLAAALDEKRRSLRWLRGAARLAVGAMRQQLATWRLLSAMRKEAPNPEG